MSLILEGSDHAIEECVEKKKRVAGHFAVKYKKDASCWTHRHSTEKQGRLKVDKDFVLCIVYCHDLDSVHQDVHLETRKGPCVNIQEVELRVRDKLSAI